MNIYEENDYRKIIRRLVAERKKLGTRVTFQALAAAARVPKSYVSRVLNGFHDFNADQLYSVAKYLRLDTDETSYVLLLLERARSGLAARQADLDARIRFAQDAKREVKANVRAGILTDETGGVAKYYRDPLHQVVHVSLAVPRFAADPAALAPVLGVPKPRLAAILSLLESIGVIVRDDKGLKVAIDNVHLPRDSDLHDAWRDQLKVSTLRRLQALSSDEAFTFSAVFTADAAVEAAIRADLLAAIRGVQARVGKAREEKVLQLNFDLFPWT